MLVLEVKKRVRVDVNFDKRSAKIAWSSHISQVSAICMTFTCSANWVDSHESLLARFLLDSCAT